MSFEPNPVTGDILVKKEIEAINQQIRLLALMRPNEMPFEFAMGVGIEDILFEQGNDEFVFETLSDMIRMNLSQNVTRSKFKKASIVRRGRKGIEVTITHQPVMLDRDIEYTIKIEAIR